MANLYAASNQWSTRPDDERFSSLKEMRKACFEYYNHRIEQSGPINALQFRGNGELMLGQDTRLSNWAFGQLCQELGAPASYLSTLPAEHTARLLNHHVSKMESSKERALLSYAPTPETKILRCISSLSYSRLWNWQVIDQIQHQMSLDPGWRVPPARPAREGQPGTRRATKADVLTDSSFGLSVKVGDWIAPAGLYASDHDMFVFLVNENYRIKDGLKNGLARGMFIMNAEVPGYAFKAVRFLYNHVCGNHIVWGAENVATFRVIHVNISFEQAWEALANELELYLNQPASIEEEKIKRLTTYKLGEDMDETIDRVYAFRFGISKDTLTRAYNLVDTETHEQDGDPRTPWGIIQGLTRVAQDTPYADERARLEGQIGKLLMVKF